MMDYNESIKQQWEQLVFKDIKDSKFRDSIHKDKLSEWLSISIVLEKWAGNWDMIFEDFLNVDIPFQFVFWHPQMNTLESLWSYPSVKSWFDFLAIRVTTWYQWHLASFTSRLFLDKEKHREKLKQAIQTEWLLFISIKSS
jgi:hypothetical protein